MSAYGDGDDTVETLNGTPDTVSCGPGNDRVVAQPADQIGSDCETVIRTG